MPFTKSEIAKMTFDELRKVKLHVSKEQNKFTQGSEEWNSFNGGRHSIFALDEVDFLSRTSGND